MPRDISSTEHLVLSTFFDNPDYQAYPARLANDLTSDNSLKGGKKIIRLNRVTAKVLCEKFEKLGVLTHRMGPTIRRPENSKYYRVNESPEAFISFCKWAYEKENKLFRWLLVDTNYARLIINRQFVLEVLRQKGICFKVRESSLRPGAEHNGASIKNSSPIDSCFLTLPVLGHYPKVFESEEEVERTLPVPYYSIHLPSSPTGKGGTVRIEDFKKRYDQVKANPRLYFHMRMESEDSKIQLTDADLVEVWKLNPTISNDSSTRSLLFDYYEIYQEEHIVLPILCLIRNSPSALFEFLLGDWSKEDPKYVYSGNVIEPIEAVLFRMVFKVIDDILNNASSFISDDPFRERAYIGKTEMDGEVVNSLLRIKMIDGRAVIYEGGLTTGYNWVGLSDDNVVPLKTNKDNSRISTMVIGSKQHIIRSQS